MLDISRAALLAAGIFAGYVICSLVEQPQETDVNIDVALKRLLSAAPGVRNAAAVRLISGVTMAGLRIDKLGENVPQEWKDAPGPDGYGVNVYSRSATGPSMFILHEGNNEKVSILLMLEQAKKGKIVPPEGYSKLVPMQGGSKHFSRLTDDQIDEAEELILRQKSREAAYSEIIKKYGAQLRPYGDFDLNLRETAVRETREEVGIDIKPEALACVHRKDSANEKWGLHMITDSYVAIVKGDKPVLTPGNGVIKAEFIDIDKIVERDGFATVPGFEGKITKEYLGTLRAALMHRLDKHINQASGGMFKSYEQFKTMAEIFKATLPPLNLMGEGATGSQSLIIASAAQVKNNLIESQQARNAFCFNANSIFGCNESSVLELNS